MHADALIHRRHRTDAFAHANLSTPILGHRTMLTCQRTALYTQACLRIDTFTHGPWCGQVLSPRRLFIQRHFHTNAFVHRCTDREREKDKRNKTCTKSALSKCPPRPWLPRLEPSPKGGSSEVSWRLRRFASLSCACRCTALRFYFFSSLVHPIFCHAQVTFYMFS